MAKPTPQHKQNYRFGYVPDGVLVEVGDEPTRQEYELDGVQQRREPSQGLCSLVDSDGVSGDEDAVGFPSLAAEPVPPPLILLYQAPQVL